MQSKWESLIDIPVLWGSLSFAVSHLLLQAHWLELADLPVTILMKS